MKFFVLTVALLASSFAEEFQNVDVDWSTVRPIEYYPRFWDDKPAELRPPSYIFENYQRRNTSSRIVNGNIAQPHQFPYQAAVLSVLPSTAPNQALCGGSFIGTATILTAAHCVDGALSGTVVLGAHILRDVNEPNQRRIAFASGAVILHPNWNSLLIRDDVALVRLPAPVPSVPGAIRAAILPTAAEANYDFANEDGVVSGWGVFSDANPVASDVLRFVYDTILTPGTCQTAFPGVVNERNICMTGTGNRGPCNGDSGGPLTVRRGGESMHCGIVSFGLALGCELRWPSVFARTTSYLDWIRANTV